MKRTIRRHSARWAAAAAPAAIVLWLGSSVQAIPQAVTFPAGSTASLATAGIDRDSSSGTGASDVSNLGSGGWKVQSSATATQTGAQISTPGFSTSTWLPVSQRRRRRARHRDRGAGAERQVPGRHGPAAGKSGQSGPNSVFFSNNMKNCFGYMTKVGADTIAQFSVPWWYRTDFTANLAAGQNATLIVNGVVGTADVWVNGTEVATSATVAGAYTRFTFDITSLLRPGTNSLAIEVNPNNPTTMLTLDNVDWTQIPPDNNTGIQFPVQLQTDGPLAVGNAHVNQTDAADLSSSALTVKTDVTNTAADLADRHGDRDDHAAAPARRSPSPRA